VSSECSSPKRSAIPNRARAELLSEYLRQHGLDHGRIVRHRLWHAEAFLEAGSEVIVCGRREDRLREAHGRHPGLHIKACDVSSDQDRSALVDWVVSSFGKLNVLVNNAGVQRDIDFTQGIAEFLAGDSELRINLEAPIILAGLSSRT